MSLTLEDPRVIEFDVRTDEMLVNMGPQHPSTHGVLRLLLRTDGDIIVARKRLVKISHHRSGCPTPTAWIISLE